LISGTIGSQEMNEAERGGATDDVMALLFEVLGKLFAD
jgi:hypothetical protein